MNYIFKIYYQFHVLMRINPKYFKYFLLVISIQAQSQQNGYIVLFDSNVVPVRILKSADKSSSSLVYNFDLVKINMSDSTKTYLPRDIRGYSTGKKIYTTLKIKTGSSIKYIFAQQLETGFASLFYYNGNIFGTREVYIFNKEDDVQYYISLETKLKGETQSNNSTISPMPPDLTLTAQINELVRNLSDANAFKSQFIRYFFDCKEVTNKLKQDWYTSTSITSLFQDYNSCTK
ncbi:MAG: hypothetical protein H7329_12630 [Opitutaceae bacterium]|nr:hypothetical protein [Cytophagales bacterium]